MSKSNYQHFRANRLNPQFVGIAEQFSQYKKVRLEVQKKKEALSSNLKYTLKLNSNLSKSLQDKAKQLERLKQIRERHNQDAQKKFRDQERNQIYLQQLRMKKTQDRLRLRRNIKDAMSQTQNYRRKLKKQVDIEFKQLSEQYYSIQQEQFQQRHNMYKTIKYEQKFGHQNIDRFYLKKNSQSLNHYKNLISDQKRKKQNFEQQIHRMSETMNIFNRKISKKQNKLAKLEEEIDYYKEDPFVQSRNSSIKNQSSASYRSKRPSQILLSDSQQLSSVKNRPKVNNPEIQMCDI